MQDKYAGHVGDFGKFIFLKHLAGLAGGSGLGVSWYRTTRPERSSNDGRHVLYLDETYAAARLFEACDPELYRRLGMLVKHQRSIAALEKSGVLPSSTRYHDAPIPYSGKGLAARLADRDAWFKNSCAALRGTDIIFLDPDNGIQPRGARKTEPRAVKYAFVDELRGYFQQCGILIIYHHRDRSPAPAYAAKFLHARDGVDPKARIRVLRFKRFSVRDYVFLYRASSEPAVRKLFSAMTSAPFDFLFEEFLLP